MDPLILIIPVILPVVAGTLCFFIKRKGVKEAIAIGVTTFIFVLSVFLWRAVKDMPLYLNYYWFPQMNIQFSLKLYNFCSTILLFASFFALFTSIYSLNFMKRYKRLQEYYTYFLWTLGCFWGALLANNLIVFLFFWGILGVLLYGFLSLGSYRLATKGIFTIGVSDFALILGALFLFKLSGSLDMDSISGINLAGALPLSAFILLAIGAIGKIGGFPFHVWIPDASEKVPSPFMAYIPASLDKLVGIYLLYRILSDFFVFTHTSFASFFLMIIGAFTVVLSVMMALVQDDMKKIIAYLNISAAGYMMMGMATANFLGKSGALFYLFSTTLWTALLFFVAGSVEARAGSSKLSLVSGTGKWMPLTFSGFVAGGLAISGVPPLNGFFSKWMIYQGIIQLSRADGIGRLWIVWLSAAMFGSVITLASIMRPLYSVFLSEAGLKRERNNKDIREAGITMTFPIILLAALCVIFGIFAYELPLRFFVLPFVSGVLPVTEWMGWWQPGLATFLIVVGIVVGVLVYFLVRVRGGREDVSYIGGESLREDMIVNGVNFYDTVVEFIGLRRLYRIAERGALDVYKGMLNFSKGIAYFFFAIDRMVDFIWRTLSYLVVLSARGASLAHNGILHTYLAWFLIGMTILIIVFYLL